MQPLPRSTPQFTYGDYCQWPDEERWELIDGEAYDMSPAPSRSHQQWAGEIFRQIANFLDDKPCEVYAAPFDVRLPDKDDEPDDKIKTVVQPDIVVVCDPDKLDEKGCRGAPDWLIEVLSPGTARKDQIRKRRLYEGHGVKEYWLVHPIEHLLTRYWLEEGHYSGPVIEETIGTTPVRTLPGLAIDWRFAEPVESAVSVPHP